MSDLTPEEAAKLCSMAHEMLGSNTETGDAHHEQEEGIYNQANNVSAPSKKYKPQHGNSKGYTLLRAHRGCGKDVWKQIIDKTISPHRAMVNAGLRKDRQLWMPEDPVKAAAAIMRKFGFDFGKQVAEHAIWMSARMMLMGTKLYDGHDRVEFMKYLIDELPEDEKVQLADYLRRTDGDTTKPDR